MYNLVASNTFTLLSTHPHYLYPNHFHHPQKRLCSHQTITPLPLSPQFLVISSLFSVSMNWPILGTLSFSVWLISPSHIRILKKASTVWINKVEMDFFFSEMSEMSLETEENRSREMCGHALDKVAPASGVS